MSKAIPARYQRVTPAPMTAMLLDGIIVSHHIHTERCQCDSPVKNGPSREVRAPAVHQPETKTGTGAMI